MSSVDSKFTKSLQIHNLENLVFQKRERKTIQQVPLPISLPHSHHNNHKKIYQTNKVEIHQKKVASKPNKAALKTKKIYKSQKAKVKRKYLTSKDLSKSKKNHAKLLQEKIKNNSHEKSKQAQQHKNTRIKSQQIKKGPKIIKESAPTLNQTRTRITRNSQSNVEKVNIQQIKKPELKKNDSKIGKAQTKQPQGLKIPKKIGRPRKIQQIQIEDYQNDSKSGNIEHKQQNKPAAKNRALLNLLQSDSKKCQNEEPETPKPRQAKLNALKRYSQKYIYADESFDNERGHSSKRKKISKLTANQNYSINRIFRKEAKLDLNPINIDVKLDKLSLNAFSQKFGTFDVIHSSLPLSMLWEVPDIQNLMVKGFIFIWVEKGQIPLAYHFLNRLGYDVIDQIVWVKCSEPIRTVFNQPITQSEHEFTQQNLFLNSKSVCFVGYKCPSGQKAEYRTKISNNLIFAQPSLKNPTKKPDEIFQIADLLMPGSKKLQLGGVQQKGWLSLHHHETRLRKCIKCFSDLSTGKGHMFKNEKTNDLSSICRKCYNGYVQQNEDDSEGSQDNSESCLFDISDDEIIKITQVQYVNHESFVSCTKCKCLAEEIIVCACQRQIQAKALLCKKCFHLEFKLHKAHLIEAILVRKAVTVSRPLIPCSGCEKTTLSSHYYECISSGCKNKRHLLCQTCFWKSAYDVIQNETEVSGSAKKKNDGLHQWRLKKIVSAPCEKLNCSCSCQADLQQPYFVCETCVGWRWCGKCKLGQHEEHHQTDLIKAENNEGEMHKLALIC